VSARFAAGVRVWVRDAHPPGHVRTPFYVRGKVGVIERAVAEFPNPEERAYGRPGTPPPWLYRVRFPQAELWPEYSGPTGDTVDVELYEHWLEPSP
jgi:nitrile hydratase